MYHLPALMAAHQDFTWDGSTPGAGDPQLLTAPRAVHAVLVEAPGPPGPWFQNYVRTGARWRALCGAEVLAITPHFFDERTKRACRRCSVTVEQWLDDPALVRWDLAVADHSAIR